MRPLYKFRSLRILAVLAVVIAGYASAGFWLAPKLLRTAIVDQSRKLLGVDATVGEIRFNPFLFRLRVADLALSGPAGTKLVGFTGLDVDFAAAASIWRREYTFREIDLAGPYADAVVEPDGSLNLARLVPKSPAQPTSPQAATAPLPRIRVAVLHVTNAQLRYEDRSHPGDFTLQFAPTELDLRDFTTGARGGGFSLAARTPLGERIAWHGRLSLQPIASQGEIRISDLRAATVAAFLHARLTNPPAFALTGGRLALDAPYRFELQPKLQLRVDGASADVTDLGIAAAGSASDWIRLPRLAIGGVSLDLAARRVQVERVALHGLDVDAWLGTNRRLNLMRLLGPASPTAPAPPAAPRWQVDLAKISIRDARLSAEDRGTRPAAKIVLEPLSLDIVGASLDPARPVQIVLATGVDQGGRFTARGEVVPSPMSAKLRLTASRIDLRALQPYVAQRTSLTLEHGLLGAKLALRMQRGRPTVALAGDLSIDGLHTIDDALREDLVDWRRLAVRGLRLQLAPARLQIARIDAIGPYARVIVEPDHRMNVKRILAAPPNRAGAPKMVAATKRGGVKVAAAAWGRRPMRITIGRVIVRDGHANFSDLSIKPNFSTGIQKLAGDVRGLDSRPGTRARVDLHGEIGPYAPVSITGRVNLLGPALYTDLTMNFRNMDLTIFNPYSGKFAGYDITKGKLTTELHYLIHGGKLAATHHVIIDQLEFGPKTHSKDAVSLPIKLAVALLKDRQGVIDLNIPVTGSLHDPKFRLGPLIWKVIVNVLQKAVTAPFRLLGALFGAGPQIQFADFRPGDAALDATDLAHLRIVAKALNARPQLKVDVPIAPLATLDGPALAEARFAAEVAEQMLGRREAPAHPAPVAAPPAGGVAAPASGALLRSLDPKSQLGVLTALYRAQFHARPEYVRAAPPPKAAQADAAKIAFLEARLQGRIHVGAADLKALAERRAVAIEKVLLSGTGIDPGRVFLVINDKVAAQHGAVRLQLSLR